jgi:hypothetical protein
MILFLSLKALEIEYHIAYSVDIYLLVGNTARSCSPMPFIDDLRPCRPLLESCILLSASPKAPLNIWFWSPSPSSSWFSCLLSVDLKPEPVVTYIAWIQYDKGNLSSRAVYIGGCPRFGSRNDISYGKWNLPALPWPRAGLQASR